MNLYKKTLLSYSPPQLASILVGSLIVGLPLATVAKAEIVAQINPCPRIFYEEPFNRSVLAPAGCPPNALGNRPGLPSQTPANSTTAPLPESRFVPVATLNPTNAEIEVRLINATNTQIAYQVIGDTNERTLMGNAETMLQGLNMPTTITFYRPDGGFINPQVTPNNGMLEVRLQETPTVSSDRRSLIIQNTGGVFLQ